MSEQDGETVETRASGHRASAAAPATATSTTAASNGSRAPPGLGEAIWGTSLWEAAYDQDQALSRSSTAEEREEDDEEDGGNARLQQESAPGGVEFGDSSSLHTVTVGRTAKLGIRVRDDCVVTHFDPLPTTGGPGPIEASGLVRIGDALVEVDGVNVEGKGVREVLALIRGAAHESVTLTFQRPELGKPQDEVGASASGSTSAAAPNPLHLTEQHRALILRHLLVGGGPHIAEDRLRFLAAHGVPDCDGSLRPLVWRILLQYLGFNRDEWEAHLKGQRQIYAQFVSDLCVLPEEAGQGEAHGPPEQTAAAATTATMTTTGEDASTAAAATGEPSPSPKRKKKLLVPSSSPPGSRTASRSSFDLDAYASFAALNRVPVTSTARRCSSIGASISASTSTSNSGVSGASGGLGASVMGASAAGSQPHFAYARPRTRVRYQGDRSLFDEIKRDVVRTYPDQAWFLDVEEGWRRYDALLRMLFIYAKVNPGLRYVQGMNEIAGTLLYVLAHDADPAWAAHAEADCFFLFTNLMAQLLDLFQAGLDQADSGIEGTIQELVDLLARHDPQLHAHFARLGLDARFFALRWITTLFSRELLLADTIRVWDSLLADAHLGDFVLFFCLAMIEEQRDTLLGLGFGDCLSLLQNYPPTSDIQCLLRRAEALRQLDARVRRGEEQGAAMGGGGPLSPTKLRGVLAKVASTIEDLELDAVAASLSTEGRRAGAQLRSSFVNMTRRLVENLSVLDSDGAGDGVGAKALPAPPVAAAAGEEQEQEGEDDDDGEKEEEEVEMVAADERAVPAAT